MNQQASVDTHQSFSQKCFQESEQLFHMSQNSSRIFKSDMSKDVPNSNPKSNKSPSQSNFFNSIKHPLKVLSLIILLFLVITFLIKFWLSFSQTSSQDEKNTLRQEQATKKLDLSSSETSQKLQSSHPNYTETDKHKENDLNSKPEQKQAQTPVQHQRQSQSNSQEKVQTNEKVSKQSSSTLQKLVQKSEHKDSGKQSQQKESADYSNLTVEWPQQSQQYHIYSALNPRLVLDVAYGSHDLILYNWNNHQNQMYYFKKAKQGYYHIVSVQYQEEMEKPQKSNANSAIKFKKESSQPWKLIPADNNIKNSFFIVSQFQNRQYSLDVYAGYARQYSSIIYYDFHRSTNQMWILRNKANFIYENQTTTNQCQMIISEMLYKVMHIPNSINEAINMEKMKLEMKNKNISLPSWLKKPQSNRIDDYDLPVQTTQQEFKSYWAAQKQLRSIEPQKQQPKTDSENSDEDDENEDDITQKKDKKESVFIPQKLAIECAINYKVAYIWYGGKQMPQYYKYLLQKCNGNIVILRQFEFQKYLQMWNQLSPPKYQIFSQVIPIRQRINMLKLLYLYFESGIYADFDTQINEDCFKNLYSDQIIFSNRVEENIDIPIILPVQEIVVPEENFMMVKKKFNPQVKRMIEEEIMEHDDGGGDRWRECKYRQCLIIECQRHYRDNTYKKGYV